MRKEYEKPILEEEKIQIEDIVAASVSADVPGVSLPGTTSPRWGRK